MLPVKYFTVTLTLKLELYQLNELYCCSTGKVNPAILLVKFKILIERSPTDIPPLNLKF